MIMRELVASKAARQTCIKVDRETGQLRSLAKQSHRFLLDEHLIACIVDGKSADLLKCQAKHERAPRLCDCVLIADMQVGDLHDGWCQWKNMP
jgi:uncharacterized protein (UPF0276 family)